MKKVQPAAQLRRAVGLAVRPVTLGHLPRAGMHERSEVTADELLGLPACKPLRRVRHEGEPAIGADRPYEIGRVLDQVAVTLLGPAQLIEQAAVDERDRSLIGETLEDLKLIV